MAKIITIYKNNPAWTINNPLTGQVDGIPLSKNGDGSSRLIADGMYPGASSVAKYFRLAIRTDSDYVKDVIVTLRGPRPNITRWGFICYNSYGSYRPGYMQVADNYVYGTSLDVGYYGTVPTIYFEKVGPINITFGIKVVVEPTDINSPDTSIDILAYACTL